MLDAGQSGAPRLRGESFRKRILTLLLCVVALIAIVLVVRASGRPMNVAQRTTVTMSDVPGVLAAVTAAGEGRNVRSLSLPGQRAAVSAGRRAECSILDRRRSAPESTGPPGPKQCGYEGAIRLVLREEGADRPRARAERRRVPARRGGPARRARAGVSPARVRGVARGANGPRCERLSMGLRRHKSAHQREKYGKTPTSDAGMPDALTATHVPRVLVRFGGSARRVSGNVVLEQRLDTRPDGQRRHESCARSRGFRRRAGGFARVPGRSLSPRSACSFRGRGLLPSRVRRRRRVADVARFERSVDNQSAELLVSGLRDVPGRATRKVPANAGVLRARASWRRGSRGVLRSAHDQDLPRQRSNTVSRICVSTVRPLHRADVRGRPPGCRRGRAVRDGGVLRAAHLHRRPVRFPGDHDGGRYDFCASVGPG